MRLARRPRGPAREQSGRRPQRTRTSYHNDSTFTIHASAGRSGTDDVARLGLEDIGSVTGRDGTSIGIDRHETHPALDNQRMVAARDDVAEAHQADGVEVEPGLL